MLIELLGILLKNSNEKISLPFFAGILFSNKITNYSSGNDFAIAVKYSLNFFPAVSSITLLIMS